MREKGVDREANSAAKKMEATVLVPSKTCNAQWVWGRKVKKKKKTRKELIRGEKKEKKESQSRPKRGGRLFGLGKAKL